MTTVYDTKIIKSLCKHTLGLKWDKLNLVSYNNLWPLLYKAESKRILYSLSPLIEKMEHIGSTSIPYCGGKPIIDMIGSVKSFEKIENIVSNLTKLGYCSLGQCGRPERYFFTYSRENTTFFHLHIIHKDSSYWQKFISFRDVLRSNREISDKYYHFKKKLLNKYGNNRNKYRKRKSLWFDKHTYLFKS